jgi:hypothetical protein
MPGKTILNLAEAKEHHENLINELRTCKNLNDLDGELFATMQEIYWHINKVWNGRKMDQKDIDNSNDDKFDRLCNFPIDLKL